MDDVELTQEQVRSLLGNMQVFERLQRGLFQQLFIDPVINNEYALAYGKKKLYALTLGMISIENNEESIAGVAESIASLNRHERAYFAAYQLARRRMANFYLELNTAEGRETFRREIRAEIAFDPELRGLHDVMTESLLEEVITKIRLEAFYINQLLPRIVEERRRQAPQRLPRQLRPRPLPDRRARRRVLRDARLPAPTAGEDPEAGSRRVRFLKPKSEDPSLRV